MGVPSQSPASLVYAVKTAVYPSTLSPLNFSNEIINYSIVPPPGGRGRGGIEAPGHLLGEVTSNLFLELTFGVEVDPMTGVNNVVFLCVKISPYPKIFKVSMICKSIVLSIFVSIN